MDKPAFETVLQLSAEEMPAEVGVPLVAPRRGVPSSASGVLGTKTTGFEPRMFTDSSRCHTGRYAYYIAILLLAIIGKPSKLAFASHTHKH